MTRAPLYRRAALAGAALLTVFACRATDLAAPQGALTPGSASPLRAEGARLDKRRQPAPVACVDHAEETFSAVFGPRGGTLHFGGSRLIIPPGALRQTVRITATPRGDASATVDFQPEGLRFRKPAGLVLSAFGCDVPAGAVPSVVYLDADGQILETIPATFDRRWKEVAAPIVHFSGYGIAL